MTHFPKNLKEYPNMNTAMPMHVSLNQLPHGYPAHRHDFLEISYVIEGRGNEVINGVSHPMVPGTLTFILPYQIHQIHTERNSRIVLFNCMFSMDLLIDAGAKIELDGLLTDQDGLPPFAELTGADHERFLSLLQDMLEEYQSDDLWRSAMLKAKLTELLVRFDRYRRLHHPISPPAGRLGKSSPTWRILHYIHRNYQEDTLTLSDLAARFSMSMSRISERIKETTDQTYHQFLHELRIRHACSLLESTEMSIAEIAYEVGFGSYKTFVRLFREYKNVSPTDYRKHKKNLHSPQRL